MAKKIDKKNQRDWVEFLEHSEYKKDSPFLRFAILWLSFVAFLKDQYTGENEGKNRWEFINEHKDRYYYLFNNDADFKKLIEHFKDTKEPLRECVFDMEGTAKPKYFRMEEMNDFAKYMQVLQRIRSNFFHGDKILRPKGSDSPNEDFELIEWAFDSFLFFWKYLLSEVYKIKLKKSPPRLRV